MQNQPYSNLIEKINIAELDSSKTYFLQMCCNYISAEQMQHVHRYITEKFDEYGIKNIIIYTPGDMKVTFMEIANNE